MAKGDTQSDLDAKAVFLTKVWAMATAGDFRLGDVSKYVERDGRN